MKRSFAQHFNNPGSARKKSLIDHPPQRVAPVRPIDAEFSFPEKSRSEVCNSQFPISDRPFFKKTHFDKYGNCIQNDTKTIPKTLEATKTWRPLHSVAFERPRHRRISFSSVRKVYIAILTLQILHAPKISSSPEDPVRQLSANTHPPSHRRGARLPSLWILKNEASQ